jgi:exopolysaccharide biosynthesis polyprenyl glycosylphosphotransferase
MEACRPAHRQAPELLAEDLFRRMLCLERKRAERSGRCVLLMVVDAMRVLLAAQSTKVLSRIVSAASAATRDTDLVGWYEEGFVLGVLFTEVEKGALGQLQKLMAAEVSARLRASLGERVAEQVRISFHSFPQDPDWSNTNGPRLMDEKIFPELRERSLAANFSQILKRAIDLFVSTFAIVLLSPLLLLISLAVKLSSEGPVLFRQKRIGQYGRPFSFLKFRSMKCDSDSLLHQEYVRRFIGGEVPSKQGTTFKITNDPRHTRIGSFLRRCSMDELPQLFNVFKGDMSLVGPRPAIPYEIDLYKVWHRSRFLAVKPGITGLWQVTGRSRTTFDDMVRLDLCYVRQWSLWLDIKILLQTPAAVLSREGAY